MSAALHIALTSVISGLAVVGLVTLVGTCGRALDARHERRETDSVTARQRRIAELERELEIPEPMYAAAPTETGEVLATFELRREPRTAYRHGAFVVPLPPDREDAPQ